MKKFHFQLETALAWRAQKEQMERIRLDQLRRNLEELRSLRGATEREYAESHARIVRRPSVDAFEVETLDAHSGFVSRERKRITGAEAQLEVAIARQQAALTEAARQTRLLEKLKERRQAAWQANHQKQIEEEAAESFLGQWGQSRSS